MVTGLAWWFRSAAALLLLVSGLVAPQALPAQELVVPLQFSFSDPGARSMGFGGAFVALADDATAAFANPAGLVQLAKPEVSIEGRRWSYSTPFTEHGRLEGLPSGFGIDTTVGLTKATSDDDVTGLSFLSVAYPKGDWSLAFFRHQLANFEFRGETQGLFAGGTSCCQIRLLDQRAVTDFEMVNHGISGAFRIGERFALGLGVTHSEASFLSEATLFFPDDTSVESLFAPNSYFPERSAVRQSLFSEDTDWGLSGGFLWRLSESWRIGGVYRQGPAFDFEGRLFAGRAVDLGVPPGSELDREPATPIDLPWVVGLGTAYRAPNGGLTVSFQWDYIAYSRIVEGLNEDGLILDDARELHLGGEYVFLGSTPLVAVRLGAWLDPDHQIRGRESEEPFLRALLPGGDDETHYAVGLGVAFERFQLDLGVDIADSVDTVSMSAIFNF